MRNMYSLYIFVSLVKRGSASGVEVDLAGICPAVADLKQFGDGNESVSGVY